MSYNGGFISAIIGLFLIQAKKAYSGSFKSPAIWFPKNKKQQKKVFIRTNLFF